MLEQSENECAESPLVWISARDQILLQEMNEEFLGQILGRFGIIVAPPNVGVNRKPVSTAEFFQGLGSLGGVALAHPQYNTPVRCVEICRACWPASMLRDGNRARGRIACHKIHGLCPRIERRLSPNRQKAQQKRT